MNDSNQKFIEIAAFALGCGYMDIEFASQLMEDFQVRPEDVSWDDVQASTPFAANCLIQEIYRVAIVDAGLDQNDGRITMYVNSIASRLYIDGDIISNYDELQTFAENLRGLNHD